MTLCLSSVLPRLSTRQDLTGQEFFLTHIMARTGQLVWRLAILSLLLTMAFAPNPPKKAGPSCSITKGGMLETFVRARAEVELPCRYIVGEFFCHAKTRILAQNSLARDKRTFVSSVVVRKSRDTQNNFGPLLEDYDEISLTMGHLRQIFQESENQTWDDTPWKPVSDNLLVSSDSKWSLHVDHGARQAMLVDENDALQVSLSYVNKNTDMSNAGGLTVVCSHPTFGPVGNSSGYLCGNPEEDDQHHLREGADRLNLSVTDYITYSILVQQDLLQTNNQCKRTAEDTATCAYPVEAISRCAEFLHRSTYVYKCFENRKISPLEAYASCVRLRCRKDWSSCKELSQVLGNCLKYKRMKNELSCEKVRQEIKD